MVDQHGFERVGKASAIKPGDMMVVQVAGEDVCLINLGGRFFAVGNICTHAGGPLNEGWLEGEEVECPYHGSRFNVTSGEVVAPPADTPVKRYQVRLDGEDILLAP